MPIYKKKLFQVFLALLLIGTSFLIYDRYINDIRLSNIIEIIPYQADWEVPPPSENDQMQLNSILQQKFTYLGEGGQSYIFASNDQKYVIKLFKYKRFRPAWFINFLPGISYFSTFKENHIKSRAKKLMTVFNGHWVAYTLNKEGSGLIFVQLNASHQTKMITLIDKLGFEIQLDLGETAYVIQEKGEMLRLVFPRLIKNGQLNQVKTKIGQIFDMYLSEYRKGIYDDDHGVMQNFGFMDDKPFHLDVGKFKISEEHKKPEVYAEDLIKVAERMRLWFRKYYPEHYEEIVITLENKLSNALMQDFVFPNH